MANKLFDDDTIERVVRGTTRKGAGSAPAAPAVKPTAFYIAPQSWNDAKNNGSYGVADPNAPKQIDIYGSGADNKSNNQKLTDALNAAFDKWKDTREPIRNPRNGVVLNYGPGADQTQLMRDAVKAAGLDPAVVPKGATLEMWKTITGYNGSGKDPLKAVAYSALPNQAGVRDALAWGLANNAPPAAIQQYAQNYADSHAGQGGELAHMIGGDNVAALRQVGQIASAIYGGPVGAAAFAGANTVADGGDIGKALENAAKAGVATYIGGKLIPASEMAGISETLGPMGSKAFDTFATKFATNGGNVEQALSSTALGIAGGAASNAVGGGLAGDAASLATTAALTGKDINPKQITGLAGKAIQGTDTYKDIVGGASDLVSSGFKNMGLDSIDTSSWLNKDANGLNVAGVNIPGTSDGGNIIPGMDANTAKKLVGSTGTAGMNIVGAANLVSNPVNGIKSLVASKAPPAVRTAAGVAPQPPAAVLAALQKKQTSG